MKKNKINIENVLKLYSKPSSKEALKGAFAEIKPQKENAKLYIALLLVCGVVSYFISTADDTIKKMLDVVSTFNTVIIAVFAVIFTGYSLFQALVDENVLQRMVSQEQNEKTFLQLSNDYFLNVMMLNFVSIIFNVILILFLRAIPGNFVLLNDVFFNEAICFVLSTGYILFELSVLIEVKSFIFNIYQLFNISSGVKLLNMIEEDEDKSKKHP